MSSGNAAFKTVTRPTIVKAIDTATTVNGKGIDCKGFLRAAFVLMFGDVTITGAGTLTLTLEESSDDSSYAAVSGFSVVTAALLGTTHDYKASGIFVVDLSKRLRYLRCVAVTSQANTTLPVAVVAVLSAGKQSTVLATEYIEGDVG